jgi:hypothetical protein
LVRAENLANAALLTSHLPNHDQSHALAQFRGRGREAQHKLRVVGAVKIRDHEPVRIMA